jgi:hypothetical protein
MLNPPTVMGGVPWEAAGARTAKDKAEMAIRDVRIRMRISGVMTVNSTLSICEKAGPDGWSFTVHVMEGLQLVCGPWAFFREGANPERLRLYSLRTGKPVRNSVPLNLNGMYQPVIACSDSQSFAIGGREIELRRLPSLETIWVKSLPPQWAYPEPDCASEGKRLHSAWGGQ